MCDYTQDAKCTVCKKTTEHIFSRSGKKRICTKCETEEDFSFLSNQLKELGLQ